MFFCNTSDHSGRGYGVEQLTTTFSNGNVGGALDGSYTYAYDARGRQVGVTQTLEGTSYTFSTAYNDDGQPTSLVYSDNEVLSYGYNGDGWLTSLVTQPSGGTTSNLLTNITYSGVGGAAGKPTGASVGNGTYTYSASYDTDLRLSSESLVHGSTTLYATTRSYDGVSNVTGVNTILSAGTDTQAFCYDEQNQLTWASSATSNTPCGGSLTAGTLTSAQYTQAFAYDATGRLTSSPTGTYTYGASAHVHGVTQIGASAYSASYDAAGDMTCRTLNNSVHCPGSPTAQPMTYDNERRLASWQNTPVSPTATDTYLYDGSGQRVEQQAVVSGTTSDTAYLLGGIEEITGGVVTKYLGVSGLPQAIRVGTSGSLNYLASDGLGSVSESLDGSGNVTAAQLYTPYGQTRYSSGAMPTAKGFTGQRADAASGLDYYGARYYDPVAGQFTAADSANDGLSRYAYVKGNPETFTDPTGKLRTCGVACGSSGGGGGSGGNGDGGDGHHNYCPDGMCHRHHGGSGSGSQHQSGSGSGGIADYFSSLMGFDSCSDHGIDCNGYFVRPLCSAKTFCLSGQDSYGLTSLLGNDLKDSTTIIVNGKAGLDFLISKLQAIQAAGDKILTTLFAMFTAGAGIVAAIAIFGAAIAPILPLIIGAGIVSGALALVVAGVQAVFDKALGDIILSLQGIQDDELNGRDLTHTEFIATETPDYGWPFQSFTVTEVN